MVGLAVKNEAANITARNLWRLKLHVNWLDKDGQCCIHSIPGSPFYGMKSWNLKFYSKHHLNEIQLPYCR